MSKGKLAKFSELETYSHVMQPQFDEVFNKDYRLKGKWKQEFFKNDHSITLELACGKGEYAVGMAQVYPGRNFLGIDIKGARLWTGAKRAIENNLDNVGFLRTRIDFINSFFIEDEIDEIWITFPDPQLRKPLKRLTSSRFLNRYKRILKPGATINLKTDSVELYEYTKKVIEINKFPLLQDLDDIYNSSYANDPILSIKTYYEKGWLEDGLKSHYLKFQIDNTKEIIEPPEEDG